MRLVLIAVGERMPAWVDEGFKDYARRMPRECALSLLEIAPSKHGKSGATQRAIEDEGERQLAALPARGRVVALDERGKLHSTLELSQRLARWQQDGGDVGLLIGGADGLAPACKQRADETWSLSPLTLPHALVRVIVAEQLYRALMVLRGHPYHRGNT